MPILLTFNKSFFTDLYLCLYFSLSRVTSSSLIQFNSSNNVLEGIMMSASWQLDFVELIELDLLHSSSFKD